MGDHLWPLLLTAKPLQAFPKVEALLLKPGEGWTELAGSLAEVSVKGIVFQMFGAGTGPDFPPASQLADTYPLKDDQAKNADWVKKRLQEMVMVGVSQTGAGC